jgi:hypothetical protein
MTDHELNQALGELTSTPSGGFHDQVMARIEELDAVRAQYHRQARRARTLSFGAVALGLAAAGAVALHALLPAEWPAHALQLAAATVCATDCRLWASAVLLAVTAALIASDAPDGAGTQG